MAQEQGYETLTEADLVEIAGGSDGPPTSAGDKNGAR